MGGFLYFIKGLEAVTVDVLSDAGLVSSFKACSGAMMTPCTATIAAGPDGAAGVLFSNDMGPRRELRFDADTQFFERSQNGKFWIGYEKHFAPVPNDLARVAGLLGPEIKLADGNLWRVPLIRRWKNETGFVSTMPRKLCAVMRDGRNVIEPVTLAHFRALDAMADDIVRAFIAEEVWTLETLWSVCLALIGQNYLIGADEAGLLGLFDRDVCLEILRQAIDVPEMERQARRMQDDNVWINEGEREPTELASAPLN
jgi:hypothetical protein